MARVAAKKVHFAPLDRQDRAIRSLLRKGRYRNVTHFMRCAIDHYLERAGRPPLAEQARQMAEDFARESAPRRGDVSSLQDASRASDEDW